MTAAVTIIIAVLGAIVAALVFALGHQKQVHAAAVKAHGEALTAEQKAHALTNGWADYLRESRDHWLAELSELKASLARDFEKAEAEPKKIVAAVKRKVTGKKA
jgi:hypothetical protein